MRARTTRLVLMAVLTTSCVSGQRVTPRGPEAAPLAARIDGMLDAPPLDRTSWGVLVEESGSGRVVYARNADRHFIPASNTKLVVSIVALGELGPTWRYRTSVYAPEPDRAGTVAELRVVGSGDPTLSSRFHGAAFAATASLADSIRAAGIRHVAGPLIIDASRFTDAQVNGTWEVGDLPELYAPPVAAFGIEEGTFAIELRGGAIPGSAAHATPLVPLHSAAIGLPQPFRITVRTDTAGASTRTNSDYTARKDTILLDASVAAGKVDTVLVAVTDPPRYAGRVLAHMLAARGVTVDSVIVLRQPEASRSTGQPIASMQSPPLAQIVAAILQPSQNWIAEQLLKTLGAERGASGSWSGGLAVERRYLAEVVGIDTLAFNLHDGSGLSAQNLLTPRATVRLLEHARAASWSGALQDALAAPGVRPSTLENRLQPLAGRLFAKTGTITNVNSLSGYLTTDGGRSLTFSILSNGSGLPSARVRAVTDSVVLHVAREVN
jgi:D-alanyl-D-alanine carboxypeptidase/D-alanyl-D-alanine-endopeptidase (penicillin-binding protein 4)